MTSTVVPLATRAQTLQLIFLHVSMWLDYTFERSFMISSTSTSSRMQSVIIFTTCLLLACMLDKKHQQASLFITSPTIFRTYMISINLLDGSSSTMGSSSWNGWLYYNTPNHPQTNQSNPPPPPSSPKMQEMSTWLLQPYHRRWQSICQAAKLQ